MKSHYIFWYALLLHIVHGVAVLISPAATHATPVHALLEVISNRTVLGLVMIGASAMSAVAMFGTKNRIVRNRIVNTALVMPQQALLLISAVGSITAILMSQYADGTPAPQLHILTDQVPNVIAAMLHTVALLAINADIKQSFRTLTAALRTHIGTRLNGRAT